MLTLTNYIHQDRLETIISKQIARLNKYCLKLETLFYKRFKFDTKDNTVSGPILSIFGVNSNTLIYQDKDPFDSSSEYGSDSSEEFLCEEFSLYFDEFDNLGLDSMLINLLSKNELSEESLMNINKKLRLNLEYRRYHEAYGPFGNFYEYSQIKSFNEILYPKKYKHKQIK